MKQIRRGTFRSVHQLNDYLGFETDDTPPICAPSASMANASVDEIQAMVKGSAGGGRTARQSAYVASNQLPRTTPFVPIHQTSIRSW
jgi:hypothetical protein